MSLEYSPRIITDGLVLCLDAFDIKSYPRTGTVWYDRSGNGNNGTLENGVGYNSDNGGTMFFDVTNDYISSNYLPPTGTTSRTISIWFKPNALQNKNLLGYGSAVNYGMWDIILYNGIIGVHLYATSAEAGTTYQAGKWQNILFTFAYPTITSYMNAVIKNTYTNLEINTGTINKLSISKGVYDQYHYFNGSIANVCIYNRALTPQEIQQNFNATRGRYGI